MPRIRDARLERIARLFPFPASPPRLWNISARSFAMGMGSHAGVSGGGRPSDAMAIRKPSARSMISAQLFIGDFSISADGTSQ